MAKIKNSLVKAIIPIAMILFLALYYLVTSSDGQNITFCEALSVIRHSVSSYNVIKARSQKASGFLYHSADASTRQ